jgi:hypothetical protein
MRQVITTQVVLAVMFLVAGVVVFIISDSGTGQGLIGTATGLALGAGTTAGVPSMAQKWKGGSNGGT